MVEDLVDQLFNSSEKRLARVLLMLAHFGKDGKPESVPKTSQETLAEMVGSTRSRVSFFMNRVRKLGFIRYNGELKVHSSLLNVLLHDWRAVSSRLGRQAIRRSRARAGQWHPMKQIPYPSSPEAGNIKGERFTSKVTRAFARVTERK